MICPERNVETFVANAVLIAASAVRVLDDRFAPEIRGPHGRRYEVGLPALD
jgi:hypothetical protein